LKCAGLKNAHIKGNWYCVKCSNSKIGDHGSGIKAKKASTEGRKRKASASMASPEAVEDEDYGGERMTKLASR
jgi:hypothetical protein